MPLIEIPRPEWEDIEWPTLGPQVCSFIEERFTFGPGSLQGVRAKIDPDQRRILYHAYEHYPSDYSLYGIAMSGRRRFQRVAASVRKGSCKTELLAWVVACELHPEAPVRFNGYNGSKYGLSQGRPVADPYIPMLAYTKEQVEELAYNALMSILESSDDVDLFDIGLDRIIRLNAYGRPDGKAIPVSGSPSARDGARTSMQAFDEVHRLYTDHHRAAIETMINNLPKRPLEDPWQMSVTTAGEPGQNSYAEDEHTEGVENWEGKKRSRGFYYFHREAPDSARFDTMEHRMAAIWEATGPGVRKWSRVDTIAALWDREGADKQYLERVWANRWTQTAAQAFSREKFEALGDPRFKIPKGAFCTLGFDGARFDDACGLVLTEIKTGVQNVIGFWEKPTKWNQRDSEGRPVPWQVPEAEVRQVFKEAMTDYIVWRLLGDPPHWVETMGDWAALYPDVVREFWTKDPTRMYYAIKNFTSAIDTGDASHDGDPDYVRHVGNAGKRLTRGVDEDGAPRFILCKISPERKYDLAIAGILSWEARSQAIAEDAQPPTKMWVPRRVR